MGSDCAGALNTSEGVNSREEGVPEAKQEIPRAVLDYVAHQLKLEAVDFQHYDWDGRTIKYHRT